VYYFKQADRVPLLDAQQQMKVPRVGEDMVQQLSRYQIVAQLMYDSSTDKDDKCRTGDLKLMWNGQAGPILALQSPSYRHWALCAFPPGPSQDCHIVSAFATVK
jgi:hypothetical protein